MDNMWFGCYLIKGMFVDQDKMYWDIKVIFDELDIDIDLCVCVGILLVFQMQMIEIVKVFFYDVKIVIMDELMLLLMEKEVNYLFKIICKLKDCGCGIVYILYKMEEIFQLCDEIIILCDGQWIVIQLLEGLDMDKIIVMMVGCLFNQCFLDCENILGEVIFQVCNFILLCQFFICDVFFDLYKGEIFGIVGLVGVKCIDIVEILFGICEKVSGIIMLYGKKINNYSVNEVINYGFVLVIEEWCFIGIYVYLDIGFNLLIFNIKKYKNSVGLLDNL